MPILNPLRNYRERREAEHRRKEEERLRKKAEQARHQRIALIVGGAFLAVCLGICAVGASLEEGQTEETASISTEAASPNQGQEDDQAATEQNEPPSTDEAPTEEAATPAASFDLASVPAYSGSPTAEVNGGEPFFTEADLTTTSYEFYSPLDSLGRCGTATACVGQDLMPTEERGSIGMVEPSGWHTVRYDDLVDGKYLYNRCHLIGYQLTGENANEKNLITGTRYMNTEAMEPYESRVADYVESTGNHVLYRSTPVFEGENLLATGVLLEAESVEDNGAGIRFCVWCYNVQPGVDIDYATGDSWREEATATQEEDTAPEESAGASADSSTSAVPAGDDTTAAEKTYILNTNTKKFHYPSCSSVDDMAEKNKKEYTGTRDEVIAQGYDPCKRCNP